MTEILDVTLDVKKECGSCEWPAGLKVMYESRPRRSGKKWWFAWDVPNLKIVPHDILLRTMKCMNGYRYSASNILIVSKNVYEGGGSIPVNRTCNVWNELQSICHNMWNELQSKRYDGGDADDADDKGHLIELYEGKR